MVTDEVQELQKKIALLETFIVQQLKLNDKILGALAAQALRIDDIEAAEEKTSPLILPPRLSN